MRRRRLAALALATLFLYASCNWIGGDDVQPFLAEPYPEKLSAWRLFEVAAALPDSSSGSTAGSSSSSSAGLSAGSPLKPNKGVIPYDLNTPLFSDYAEKYRFVWMPSGSSAVYTEEEAFEFPIGTIISKTFAFPSSDGSSRERLIETRLLVKTEKGWVALPYIWNDEQSEATLAVAGGVTDVEWRDRTGAVHRTSYSIPNTNECAQCHERDKKLLPIGPKARHLNREYDYPEGRANQLVYWSRAGYLRGAPDPDAAPRAPVWNDPASGTVEARARTYLDINCAHCHQSGGSAGYTGFLLGWKEQDKRRLGYCKNPNSAGYSGNLEFDLVPGRPEESILIYRMMSTRPKEMMPEIGRSLAHREGIVLVREWLAALEGDCPSGAK